MKFDESAKKIGKVYIGDNKKFTYGKSYSILELEFDYTKDWQHDFYTVTNDNNLLCWCKKDEFISFIEYRKLKLNKINESSIY